MTIAQYYEHQLVHSLNKVVEEQFSERQIMKGFAGAAAQANFNGSTPDGLLNFNTSTPRWKTEFEYEVYTSVGMAEFYTCCADDIPMVDDGKEIIYGRLKTIAVGKEFCYMDLERDQNMGGRAVQQAMRAAHIATDNKLEDIFFNGESIHRLYGLLNFPNVTVQTLPNDGAGALTTIASKTPAQKYRDAVSMTLSVSQRSKNAFSADTLLLPLSVYNDLNTTIFTGATTTGDTVLEIIRRNGRANPFGIQNIYPVPFLDGKGTLPGTGVAIAYSKKADNQEAFISDYMNMWSNSEGQSNDKVNFKSSFIMTSVAGGTIVYQPLAIVKFDSI